jgi:hypothetical protein
MNDLFGNGLTALANCEIAQAVTIGPHRLFLGDANAIRPTLGWQDCDCMDPPYKFNNSGGGKWRKARGASEQIIAEGLTEGFDPSIIKPTLCGSAVVFCHDDQLPDLLPVMRGKFWRHRLCFWRKKNPAPHCNKAFVADLEPYIFAWQRGYHPQGGYHQLRRTVDAQVRPAKIYGHPTVKPDSVMDKIMANVAGQTVCDPFMGTGSTGVAAIKAGKTFTGIEHNPTHFKTALRRIGEAYEANAA